MRPYKAWAECPRWVVKVVVTEIDDKGRVNVSARDLVEKPKGYEEPKPRRDFKSKDGNGEKRVFKKRD